MIKAARINFIFRRAFLSVFALLACLPLSWAEGPANEAELNRVAANIIKIFGVSSGFAVHLGCGDGLLTAALRGNGNLLVQGLATNAATVDLARKNIEALGLYGPVSIRQYDGKHLPYIDNLANLVAVEDPDDVSMEEVFRVLAPLGVACVKRNGEWTKTVKPWPENIDEWTHYLHGPDNYAVAIDTVVAPPKGVQWVCGPLWSRAHSTLNGTACMVSARGRIFTIEDHAPISMPLMPGKYKLVARGAFNGITLWEQPLESWESITHWMSLPLCSLRGGWSPWEIASMPL